jgi:hypothetical protein
VAPAAARWNPARVTLQAVIKPLLE